MKLLFLNMLFEMTPLGMLNVVTYLEKNGYPSKHVYITQENKETPEEVEAILDFIEKDDPDLLGMSLMSFNFFRSRDLVEKVRERFPKLLIVWGGIHPTFNPEESTMYADYVCVGEGEDAMLDLVRALDQGEPVDNIPNIWLKKNDEIIRNDVRPLIQNLDDYPFPTINWESTYCLDEERIKPLTMELYRKNTDYAGTTYDIMISRGCPYNCNYCCNSLFRKIYKGKGKYVRYRSVDNAIEELKYAKKIFPFIKIVNIQDDSFAAASEEYLADFVEKYKKEIALPLRVRIVPTHANETRMKLLADANTLVAVMGLQANDRINREVFNRKVSSETFLNAARMIRKHNIVGQYDLIIRNPFTTEQDMEDLVEILSRIPKPYKLEQIKMGFFPNTPLRDMAIEAGIEINEMDGYATKYGNYPERFPTLMAMQEACQYSPGWLIRFFMRHRKTWWGQPLFNAYFRVVHRSIHKLRNRVLQNTKLVLIVKKAIFLPRKITKAIMGK